MALDEIAKREDADGHRRGPRRRTRPLRGRHRPVSGPIRARLEQDGELPRLAAGLRREKAVDQVLA